MMNAPQMSQQQAMDAMRQSLMILNMLQRRGLIEGDVRQFFALPPEIAQSVGQGAGDLDGYVSQMGMSMWDEVQQAQPDDQPSMGQPFTIGGGATPFGDIARTLASQGRYGDSEIAHVNPEEAALLRALGGSGSINPDTGLPEYWGVKSVFRPARNVVKSVVKPVVKAASSVMNSPVGKVVTTAIAIATQQYWAAALTMASMAPGKVGEYAKIANAIYGVYNLGSGLYNMATKTPAELASLQQAEYAGSTGKALFGGDSFTFDTWNTLNTANQIGNAVNTANAVLNPTWVQAPTQSYTSGMSQSGTGGSGSTTKVSMSQRPSAEASGSRALLGSTSGSGGETGDVEYSGFGGRKSGASGAFRSMARSMA